MVEEGELQKRFSEMSRHIHLTDGFSLALEFTKMIDEARKELPNPKNPKYHIPTIDGKATRFDGVAYMGDNKKWREKWFGSEER